LGAAFIDSTGNYITMSSPETISSNYSAIEKETLAAYGVKMWIDLFPTPASMGVSKHGQAWQYTLPPDVNAKVSEADDLSKRALANMVLGRPEAFDAAWTRFQAELRAIGIEDANKAMTALVKDKMKLWGLQ
jgi:putative aldouronate transport system substrate-binding protein